MAYDPTKPAQLSIQGPGRRHYIQDGIEYAYHPPHEPLDPGKAAVLERENEARRAASAPRVTLSAGEELVDLGRGVYVIDGPHGQRGPYLHAQIAHLIAGVVAPAVETAPQRAAVPLTLGEGERLEERGNGWYVVVGADGQQAGPARRQKDVAHLLPGDAA